MAWNFDFGDFGYGIDEERRRAAIRRAIAEAGARISAGAATEGFGSLNAGFTTGMMSYRDQLERMHLDELKARERAEEDRYIQEERDYRREERERQRRERAEKEEAERAERDARRRALEKIDDPELRGELELRMGQDNWWSLYDRVTAPPKREKPEVREVGGDLYERDPETGGWKLVLSGRKGGGDDRDRAKEEAKAEAAARKAASKKARELASGRDRTLERARKAGADSMGPFLARAQPVGTEEELRGRILPAERRRERWERGLDDPLDELDRAGTARGPASAASKDTPPRAKVSRSEASAMIAAELEGIPERNREAAGRDLWRAWELGVFP